VVGFFFCAYVKLNKSKGFCFGALPVLFYEIHELKFDEEKKEKHQQQQQQKFGRCWGGGGRGVSSPSSHVGSLGWCSPLMRTSFHRQ
jgi:hypothetical protein